MDSGIAIRAVANTAATDYSRSASAPVQQSVQTDLDAAKTVTAAAVSDQIRNELLSGREGVLSRQYVIDPATREVIFRIMDTRTRQVVRQVPDEALLRMRAYVKALTDGKSPTAAAMLTDFEA